MKKMSFFIIAFLILSFSFLRLGCLNVPNDLVLPQWDVELNVPLIDTTYKLSDIININKTSYISISRTSSNDSIYVIQSDDYSQTIGISQFVQALDSTSKKNITVPALNNQQTTIYLQFPKNAQLDSATFQSGEFKYQMKNTSAVEVTVFLKIPGVHTLTGTTLEIHRKIPPSGVIDSIINFANYKYNLPSNQPPFFKNSLQIVLEVKAAVTSGTNIEVSFFSKNFFFSSVTGYLPKQSLGQKRESFALNLGDAVNYREKAFLGTATLNLEADYLSPVSNPFDIGIKNLNIIGKRKDGSTFYLKDSTGNANLNYSFTNGKLMASFNQNNSNITGLISFIPDSVVLIAEYIMNPDNKTGTATSQDSIRFKSNFKTNSYLALRKSSITDTSEVKLSSDSRKQIRKARRANITVEVQNGIPITTWMKISLVDSNYNPLFTIRNLANGTDSLYFAGADVTSSGDISQPVTTNNSVVLDSLQVNQLSHAAHAIFSFSIRTKDAYKNPPPLVKIRPSDKIHIRAFGGVKYHLNPSEKN